MTRPRVLLALQTCDLPKYHARLAACLDTWAKELPSGYDLKICTGATLGVRDDYSALCAKSHATVRYALEHGYDHLLSVDDDSYLRTDRLAIPAADYAGWVTDDLPAQWYAPFCQGGAYWLSRRAMEAIAEVSYGPSFGSACDGWFGTILRLRGIAPMHLPDYVVHPATEWIHKWRAEAAYTAEWTALLQIPSDAEFQFAHENTRLHATR